MSFVKSFSHLFRSYRHDVSAGARQYLAGLMQAGERKNMLHMAEVVPDTDARNLQQFLTHSKWSARAVMEEVAQAANAQLGHGREACLLLDESGFAKQGNKSVGVARQWLGRLGKVDNGQVGVFGVLCRGPRAALVDARLYLPKEWTEDPARCQEAGVPEPAGSFRTKDELAVEIIVQARKQGLKFGWVGADAGYGKSAAVFYRLASMGETFFIDVPSDFGVYLEEPQPGRREAGRRGCPAEHGPTRPAKNQVRQLQGLAEAKRWKVVTVRQTSRGRLKLRAWQSEVYVWQPGEASALRLRLLVTENLDGTERKYTLSNAATTAPLKRLVYQQRQRYWVERVFEDGKGQCGMADYQVQKWSGWHHHMALVMLAMLFMLTERIQQRENYPLLSCADIEGLLARFLPRRDLNEREVIEQIGRRHRLRQRAMRSHARRARKRENQGG